MNKINEFEEKWYGRYSEQYADHKIRKQFLIFCSLCSERDRELMEGRRALDMENFRRIGYLISAMGFDELFLDFENLHPELLLELAGDSVFMPEQCQEKNSKEKNQKEKNQVLAEEEIQGMLREIEAWTEEFCRNVPERGMQKYIRELLTE